MMMNMAICIRAFCVLAFLLVGTVTAKGRGGGGGSFSSSSKYGGGGSGSTSLSGSNSFGRSSSTYYGPVRSNGGGYASGSGSRYSPSLYGGFFLGSSYRRNSYYRNNRNNNEADDYDTYFDRLENGCQLTGVDSYRTIDTSNNVTSIWTGCSEEWRYNVEVTNVSSIIANFTFVSPPLELYACSENDSCSACQNGLKGEEYDALTLVILNPNKTYPVDCYVPKNLTLVNETFNCINEECVFLSEKYDNLSSDATAITSCTALLWAVMASSGIAITILSIFG